MRTCHLNGWLIVGVLLIATAPLYAQGQQPDVAKLKEEVRKVVGMIGGDRAKTQIYCQILDLSDQADQENDSKKRMDISQKIDLLQKRLVPDFVALVHALDDINPDSPDGKELSSIFGSLDESCG